MSNVLITCSKCHKPKWLKWLDFKSNLNKFNVNNVVELNKIYVCRPCRKQTKLVKKQNRVALSGYMIRQLHNDLQEQFDIFIERGGINDAAASKNFAANVKILLAKKYIVAEPRYLAVDKMVTGVEIEGIPFIGKLVFEFKRKGT